MTKTVHLQNRIFNSLIIHFHLRQKNIKQTNERVSLERVSNSITFTISNFQSCRLFLFRSAITSNFRIKRDLFLLNLIVLLFGREWEATLYADVGQRGGGGRFRDQRGFEIGTGYITLIRIRRMIKQNRYSAYWKTDDIDGGTAQGLGGGDCTITPLLTRMKQVLIQHVQ